MLSSVIVADVDLEGEGSVKYRANIGFWKSLRESDFSKISQAELKHEAQLCYGYVHVEHEQIKFNITTVNFDLLTEVVSSH